MIQKPYTIAEIKAKVASADYSAELMLQHALLHLDALAAQPARAGGDAPTVDAMVEKAWGRFEAESQRLSSLKQRFFAFDEEVGFDTYDTAEQAQAAAEESIAQYRAGATDEWDSDVENVCWGVILGRPEQVEVGEPNDDGERAVDYRLAALAAAPQPAPAEQPGRATYSKKDVNKLLNDFANACASGADALARMQASKAIHEYLGVAFGAARAAEHPAGGAVPAIYVNAEQLAAHKDPDDAEPFGRYLPARKTRAGKFTLPLYTAAPAAVERDALVTAAKDRGFTEGTIAALAVIHVHGAQVIWEEVLEAAGKDAVLQHAAHIEPEDWWWAGFNAYVKTKPECAHGIGSSKEGGDA